MKKLLMILLLFSCSEPVVEPLIELLISQDGSWHSNYYNLSFDVEDDEIMNLNYEEAYGGLFTFDHEIIEDSLRFDIKFVPDNNNYRTHTTMAFEWMYKSDVHLGVIKGTIYYDNGDEVNLYKGRQYITLERQ